MHFDDVNVGDELIYGRPHGAKARCVVLKLNKMSAKIKLLEQFGENKNGAPGRERDAKYRELTPIGQEPKYKQPKNNWRDYKNKFGEDK